MIGLYTERPPVRYGVCVVTSLYQIRPRRSRSRLYSKNRPAMGGFSDYIPVFRLLQDVILHQRYYLSIKIRRRPRTAGPPFCFRGLSPCWLYPPCFCADCEAIRTKAGGRAQPAKISPGRAGAARSRAKAWPGGQRQAPPGGGRGHYRPAPIQGCPRTARRAALNGHLAKRPCFAIMPV